MKLTNNEARRVIVAEEESSGGGVRSRGRSLEKGKSSRASSLDCGPFKVGPNFDYGDTSGSSDDEKDFHDAPTSK